jgi:Ca-activated chloride channel family protein
MKHRFVLSFAAAVAGALSYFAASTWSQPRVRPQTGLQPVPFQSEDGAVTGWKITIPGQKPLATPAVVDGRVFVGGGFGSHEFYAFDAVSGKSLWTYHTSDDGPTAAVVDGPMIIFNTESCELETITRDGKPLWKKWLGDPLMSMPAVADGTVYMAYPNSRGDQRYYLAAFETQTGRELWKKPIAGEIITAPVIEDKQVYVATIDGSLFSFDRQGGTQIIHEARNATSAPAVWNGQVYFSRRERAMVALNGKQVEQQNEVFSARKIAPTAPVKDMEPTKQKADYLDYSKRRVSKTEASSQAMDQSVGFGGVSKGSANVSAMRGNLGQASVHGVWEYQGSKSFVDKGRLFSSMGDKVMSVDPKTEKVVWSRTLHDGKDSAVLDSELTPPAIVNGKVFVGTRSGEVIALSEKTGEVIWRVKVGEPVVFQPAVVAGRVYVSTASGTIYCLNTGDRRDDGWMMWGGNGSHNGVMHAE